MVTRTPNDALHVEVAVREKGAVASPLAVNAGVTLHCYNNVEDTVGTHVTQSNKLGSAIPRIGSVGKDLIISATIPQVDIVEREIGVLFVDIEVAVVVQIPERQHRRRTIAPNGINCGKLTGPVTKLVVRAAPRLGQGQIQRTVGVEVRQMHATHRVPMVHGSTRRKPTEPIGHKNRTRIESHGDEIQIAVVVQVASGNAFSRERFLGQVDFVEEVGATPDDGAVVNCQV